MTVGIGIKCADGIVLSCDSLATFSRGAPIKRFSNKAYVIEHDGLEFPVAVIGAGMSAFIDKFIDETKRDAINHAANDLGNKLDIIDFCDLVCEPLAAMLFKKYWIERNQFFGAPIGEFSIFIIVAGATRDGELRVFFVHPDGLTENISDYGTIGSGAAYAELFLRDVLFDIDKVKVEDAACLSVYAAKGVELMDPNVGGKTNVLIIKMVKEGLEIEPFPSDEISDKAKEQMKDVLKNMSENMHKLIGSV